MREIDLQWEGPFTVPYDRDSDRYRIPLLPDELILNARIYCIYGRHPVYGQNALLYIGETKSSDTGRRIIDRLKEHFSGRFLYQTELIVYLGQMFISERRVGHKPTIKAVESLLIATHMPALNQKHINGPIESAKDIHVVNYGFCGALVPECSGRSFDWS